MLPSTATLGVAILASASGANALKFSLQETYDYTNFFDKFNFFESNFNTGNYNDVDPTSGHVNYQSKTNAQKLGLVSIKNKEAYIGVDYWTKLQGAGYPGRKSVRLESKNTYGHGLLIARFSHLPLNKCGTWPAFWAYGDDWPNQGEVDLYENWNENTFNTVSFHTGSSSKYGTCTIDGTGMSQALNANRNCDNTYQNPPQQYLNQGCTSTEKSGTWANPNGGTYALEFTKDEMKIYAWPHGTEPSNIARSTIDTKTWGTPSVYLKNSLCNIDKHFGNQRLVLNLDFCGVPAGLDSEWSKGGSQSCKTRTGDDTCVAFVSRSPGSFKNVYFQVKDIRFFKGI